jgi:hypothetical protein
MMAQYFAVFDGGRQGPFHSVEEPIALLKRISKERSHTLDQAQHFFLHDSAVEQVETVDGKPECLRLGWVAREEWGALAPLSDDTVSQS